MPAPPKPRSNVQRILGDMLTFEYIPLKDRAARAKANLLAAGKGTGKAMLGAIGAPADLIQLGSDAGSWLTGSTPQALPGADYMPTTEHLTSWADQALGGNSFLTRAPQNPGEAQATANTEALGMFNPLTDFKMAAAAGAIIPAAKKAAEEGVEKLGRIATGEPAKLISEGKFKDEVGGYLRDVERPDFSRAQNRERNTRNDAGDWAVQNIPIRSMYGTQKKINPEFFPEALKKDDLPFVVRSGGKYYVQDGHHRLAALAKEGKQTADVRVVDLDHTPDTGTPLLDWKPPEAELGRIATGEPAKGLAGQGRGRSFRGCC